MSTLARKSPRATASAARVSASSGAVSARASMKDASKVRSNVASTAKPAVRRASVEAR